MNCDPACSLRLLTIASVLIALPQVSSCKGEVPNEPDSSDPTGSNGTDSVFSTTTGAPTTTTGTTASSNEDSCVIHFPDVRLRMAVCRALGGGEVDCEFSCEALLSITVLAAQHFNITSLQGITYLRNLEDLYLEGNAVAKIENVTDLPKLRVLDLEDNGITKIEGLETLTSVQKIWLRHNGIAKIEGFETLVNLQNLYLDNNDIAKVEGLETLASLRELYLDNNELTETELLVLSTPTMSPWLNLGDFVTVKGNPIDCKSQDAVDALANFADAGANFFSDCN